MKRNNLIDIALNLTDPVFQGIYRGKEKHINDLSIVLERAVNHGCSKFIITGTDEATSRQALTMALKMENGYCTIGVHPTHCMAFEDDPKGYFETLLQLAQEGKASGKCVAIGECGLDYDRLQFCSREIQLKYFQQQFHLAEKVKLPMFLHNRNTSGDFVDMVSKNRSLFTDGVVHSYTGNLDEMKQLIALDLYIGINGCSLKTQENLDVVKAIPLNRIMLETDAPWCDIRKTHASFPLVKTTFAAKKAEKHDTAFCVKGRNEPCHIVQVLEVVAALHGKDEDEVAQQVYENTMKVFFNSIT